MKEADILILCISLSMHMGTSSMIMYYVEGFS